MQTTILAIETSCDETAVSIVQKHGDSVNVLSSIVSSQIALHAPFGGVVPDLAAREHAKNILPVLKEALFEAHVNKNEIDAIAVTSGPGLIPALLIGATAAKTLAYTWKKPLLGIHHIEGHIYANYINELHKPSFPLLALVVSGGHTQLVFMHNHFDYKILGETLDDAVGEAFDKVAKMLGLPYPGGPIVAKRADEYAVLKAHEIQQKSDAPSQKNTQDAIMFPRPMLHSGDYNFSFSGLKTSVLYTIKKHPEKQSDELFKNEVCYEFQEAVIETLLAKTQKALEEYSPKTLVIAGGVSANTTLRSRLTALVHQQFPDTQFIMPEFKYSLDNAAMIGAAATFRFDQMPQSEKKLLDSHWETLRANAQLTL